MTTSSKNPKTGTAKTTNKNEKENGKTTVAKKQITKSNNSFKPIIVEEKSKVQTAVVVTKKDQINDVLSKLGKAEKLKASYGKFKVKQNNLREAHKKMQNFFEETPDQFEEGEALKFPFEIVIRGLDQYDRKEEIFKISKKETVSRFVEILLEQLDDLLEAFEADLIEYSKEVNI